MKRLSHFAVVGLILSSSGTAEACGVCVLSMVDYILPPGLFWFFYPVVGFLFMSAACSFEGERMAFIPTIGRAVVLSLVCIILGASLVGPIATIPLGLPVIVATFRMWRLQGKSVPQKGFPNLVLVAGIAFCAVGLSVSLWGVMRRASCSQVEFMVQWPTSPITRGRLDGLRSREPESLEEYRGMIDRGVGSLDGEIAGRIAELGFWAEDSSRLERARLRHSASEEQWLSEDIAKAIEKLRTRQNGAA